MCVAAASYLPRESPGRTLVGRLASSRESRAVTRESAASIFDFFTAWRAFLLRLLQWWPVLPIVARSEQALSMPTCPPAKVMELTCRLPTCRVQASIVRLKQAVDAAPRQRT